MEPLLNEAMLTAGLYKALRVNIVDSDGVENKSVDDKLRVSSMPYLYDIAEGNVTGHTPWSKVGYNPAVTTALEDVWSSTGVYAFPASAIQMEVDSTDADDVGVVLYGNIEGANQTILCDVCTATTFVDGGVNFANVEVGDCILISPKGTTPQWGYVTDVTNKATGTLGVGGGWSGAIVGSAVPSGEAYTIVDQNGDTGAQVVKIDYLTGTYAEKTCLVCLSGTTDVAIDGPDGAAVLDKFRINSFSVIAAGTSLAPEGDLSLRAIADTPIYSFITNGYNRARNAQYTVPSGKTLYVTSWNVSAATPADAQNRVCRVFTMANREPASGMLSGSIFYGYTECLVNGQASLEFDIPTRFREKTDIRVRCQGATGFSGPVTSVLRGWLEV